MRCIPIIGSATLLAALLYSISACNAQVVEFQTAVPQDTATEAAELLDAPPAPPEVHLNLIDQKLALSLAIETHAQIEMGEFASRSIASDALRRLVTTRLESLREFAAELSALSEGRTQSAIEQAQREIDRDRAPNASRDSSFRLLSLRNATAMLARIRLEIQQEYAEMVRGDLAAKSNEQFDRHYLRFDVLNQMQSLAAFKVFDAQASADFARVIHLASLRAQGDLDRSRQLLLQLETAPLAETAPVAIPVETSGAR